MGVGGNFWDLLKPYARPEGFDFLRNKRVAVDLSFWIVQNETAIKGYVRNPHIRLTFFRTINLFSKFGAFPVFVVDGTPSPLKSQARILRFFRASGVDLSSFPVAKEGISVERNSAFQKCVKECVDLLQLLGMPVLKAEGEAEAFCAQLNREGHVDACITADSDAFLFGAKCVIKHIHPNSKGRSVVLNMVESDSSVPSCFDVLKDDVCDWTNMEEASLGDEPLECYHISDIETGLGLKRKHFIAISLLVGNDHDLNGIRGIGIDTAIRFVKPFSEDEVLSRLCEVGKGENIVLSGDINSEGDPVPNLECPKRKLPHCSLCGHPGSKKAHFMSTCQYCCSSTGCMPKPQGFTCNCTACNLDQEAKQKRKKESWQLKICEKIASEPNFPSSEIVDMYLRDNNGRDDGHLISWDNPQTEMLIDFLAYSQSWEPSYIRQKMLPLMSTILLRDVASNPNNTLLCGQYEFHSIQRVKVRLGHQFYVVKWKKAASTVADVVFTAPEEPSAHCQLREADESNDSLDEADVPQIYIENGCWFLLTDEDVKLVQNAFPEKVNEFLKEKELKEMKSKRKKTKSKSGGVQLSITEFYRSSKVTDASKPKNAVEAVEISESSSGSPGSKSKGASSNFSKSARRRLLFG